MGDVLVTGGKVSDGKIEALEVQLHGLPGRTIDRDTALSWMKDGHSFIPQHKGQRGTALQLVEVGDERYIRPDNGTEAADALPDLG